MAGAVDSATSSDIRDHIHHLNHQLKTARSEIKNLRHQVISLTSTHRKDCEDIKEKLRNATHNADSRVSGVVLKEDAATSSGDTRLAATAIGTVSTDFPEKRGTPRQPTIGGTSVAKLVLSKDVFTNPEHALHGLEEYSHMWILYYFDRNETTHTRAKIAPPRLNGSRTGVFATRSPHRPSPIGMSLVKIESIRDDTIYFSGVDMLDQTPVLDIKPYIPHYDNPVYLQNSGSTGNSGQIRNASNPIEQDESSIETEMQVINQAGNETNMRDESRLSNVESRQSIDGNESLSNLATIRENLLTGRSSDGPLDTSLEDAGHYYNRSTSRMGEREAPDGEEEEDDGLPNPSQHLNLNSREVRVPHWIDNPPVSTLSVTFKDSALIQLAQLGSPEAEEKKSVITNVLREDPRSSYLRERLGSHCYVFRIANLNVSCRFNDARHNVTVFKIFANSDVIDVI